MDAIANPAALTPVRLHDVEIIRSKKQAHAKVEPVPPEEFGVSRNTRLLKDCDYCFHKVLLSEAKFIAQGFDSKQIKAIPTYTNITNTEEIQRDTVNEYQFTGDENNQAARRIEVTEHYVRMDYEKNGKPCLYKVTTAGHQGGVLKKNGKPDIEQIDFIPFAVQTPVPQTHRFFGRSIADLVMDIQRIKTELLRGVLDNAYLANNPRVLVAQQGASPETLDDLLVSRPGGVVRAKTNDAVVWQTVPSIASECFPVIEYMDATREWRTGVTRQGQGIDASALQNQSATAVSQLYSVAQARMRLIARIFAETGIRDLFWLLHAIIRKHGDQQATFRLRNQWVTVDPRQWKTRNDMTIHVGLGQGSKGERLQHLMTVIGAQKDALINGLTNLVQPKHLYNSARELCKLVGLPNVDQFFSDPSQMPPPQGQPDPKLIEIQLKAQLESQAADHKAQLEQQKMQADVTHQQAKNSAEIELARQKFEMEKQLKITEAQLKAETQAAELHHKEQMGHLDVQLQARKQNLDADAKAASGGLSVDKQGQMMMHPHLEKAFAHMAEAHAKSHEQLMKALMAPRKTEVVRHPNGRIAHVVSKVEA